MCCDSGAQAEGSLAPWGIFFSWYTLEHERATQTIETLRKPPLASHPLLFRWPHRSCCNAIVMGCETIFVFLQWKDTVKLHNIPVSEEMGR